MVLNETIKIPHYAVGWGESCSAKLGVQCSYGGTILETFTFEKIIPSVQLLSLLSFDRLTLTPPVAQPPNHHRGLLLILNTAVSFVRFPNLGPRRFPDEIEGGEVHCRTRLSFREIATDRFWQKTESIET